MAARHRSAFPERPETPWERLDWPTALEAAVRVDDAMGLLPADVRRQLLEQAGAVMASLNSAGLPGPASLLTDRPPTSVMADSNADLVRHSIATAAGRDSMAESVSAAFSTYRNATFAALGLTFFLYGRDISRLLSQFPTVMQRNADKFRPLTHDEVAASRVGAWHCLSQPSGKSRQRGVYYILSEIGARPGETTRVTDLSFDSHVRPARLSLEGLRVGATARDLPLDRFESRAMHIAIEAIRRRNPAGTRLAYRGEMTTNKELCAAASGPIKQFLHWVGLTDPMLTASSVCKYRASVMAEAGNLNQALALVGATNSDRALTRLQHKRSTARDIELMYLDDDWDWRDGAA